MEWKPGLREQDQQLEGLPALPSGRSILSRGKERAMSALHRPSQVLATFARASAQCGGTGIWLGPVLSVGGTGILKRKRLSVTWLGQVEVELEG